MTAGAWSRIALLLLLPGLEQGTGGCGYDDADHPVFPFLVYYHRMAIHWWLQDLMPGRGGFMKQLDSREEFDV